MNLLEIHEAAIDRAQGRAPQPVLETRQSPQQWLAHRRREDEFLSRSLPSYASLTLVNPDTAQATHFIRTLGVCVAPASEPVYSVDHVFCLLTRIPITISGQEQVITSHLTPDTAFSHKGGAVDSTRQDLRYLIDDLAPLIPPHALIHLGAYDPEITDVNDQPLQLVVEIARQLQQATGRQFTSTSVKNPPAAVLKQYDFLAHGSDLTPINLVTAPK